MIIITIYKRITANQSFSHLETFCYFYFILEKKMGDFFGSKFQDVKKLFSLVPGYLMDSRGSFDDYQQRAPPARIIRFTDEETVLQMEEKQQEEEKKEEEDDDDDDYITTDLVQYASNDPQADMTREQICANRIEKAFQEIKTPIVAIVLLKEYQKLEGKFFPYDYNNREIENRPSRAALPLETGEIVDFDILSSIFMHMITLHQHVPFGLFLEPVIPGVHQIDRCNQSLSIFFTVDFANIDIPENQPILEINLLENLSVTGDKNHPLIEQGKLEKIWMMNCFLRGFEKYPNFPAMEFKFMDIAQSEWAVCRRDHPIVEDYENTFSTLQEFSIIRRDIWGAYILPFATQILNTAVPRVSEGNEYRIIPINMKTIILFYCIKSSPKVPEKVTQEIEQQFYINDRVFRISLETFRFIEACLLRNTQEHVVKYLKIALRRADLNFIKTLSKKKVELELFIPHCVIQRISI